MNAFVLLIPILLIRYGLLGMLNKEALKRAAYFPPLLGVERTAYWVYQVTTLLIFVYLFFLKIRPDSIWFIAGLLLYALGTVLYIVSIINYAAMKDGVSMTGLYRVSRNPMYVSYFLYFLGCALLTRSLLLLLLVLVFQVSSHWIILSEERWCVQKFGQEYVRYMERVGRYV
jgi:protein-S-isoprenylcysteine O-methyltransferase Ste14